MLFKDSLSNKTFLKYGGLKTGTSRYAAIVGSFATIIYAVIYPLHISFIPPIGPGHVSTAF